MKAFVDPAVEAALTIEVPASRLIEYGYAARLLFEICQEAPVRIVAGQEGTCRISGPAGVVLDLKAGCADLRDQASRNGFSIIRVDVPQVLRDKGLPDSLPVLQEDPAIGGDLLLSAFYVASGAWELDHAELDQHQRVRGSGSWLARHGLLSLPSVHAYSELLKLRIAQAGVELPAPQRAYRRWVTCDVDQPRDEACYSASRMIKRLGRNVVVERSVGAMRRTLRNYRRVREMGWSGDPNNTFDYLMTTNERLSNAVTFFLICGGVHQLDANYSIEEPWVRALMRSIHQRGHGIGLHGSFESLRLPGQLRRELSTLTAAPEDMGISAVPPSRQHYLRWFPATAVKVVAETGIRLDSSLGFQDICGFRRGMCCAFPLFDLADWRCTEVMERPLIVMECAELGREFDIPGEPTAVLDGFMALARQCRIYDGTFTLLWHNSFLHQAEHREMYEAVAGA